MIKTPAANRGFTINKIFWGGFCFVLLFLKKKGKKETKSTPVQTVMQAIFSGEPRTANKTTWQANAAAAPTLRFATVCYHAPLFPRLQITLRSQQCSSATEPEQGQNLSGFKSFQQNPSIAAGTLFHRRISIIDSDLL